MDMQKETFDTWNNIAKLYLDKFMKLDLDHLKAQMVEAKFEVLSVFNVQYKTSETEFDIHTILIAKMARNSCYIFKPIEKYGRL